MDNGLRDAIVITLNGYGIVNSKLTNELMEVIGQYHRELVPLIVPITLFNHHIRRLDEPYLKRQVYLNPTPVELMLRNHV